MRPWRGSLIHAGVLVIALAAAWRTWTRPQAAPKTDSSVKMWDASADEVQAVEFIGEKRHVKIEQKEDDDGAYLWVTVEKENPQPKSPTGSPATEEPERTKKAFIGGKTSKQVFELFAAPTAVRALGKPEGGRMEELGLDDPEARITAKVGKESREVQLGAKVYGGSERYVLDTGSGEVFVLQGATLRNLEVGDTSLMQRDLHEFGVEEIRRARLTVGDKSRELVRLEGSAKVSDWARADTPKEKDETASAWMARIAQLRALEYVTDETEIEAFGSGTGASTELLRLELAGEGGKALGFLEMFRIDGGEKPEYRARTETTRSRVKVSQRLGDLLENDISSIIGP